ncbi:MAG: flagellar basal body L-ring protein FlgH [Betaproteobacteria bacterium]|nr:flagellar basal body L-ring protein FlgH [Betaproteobacteria bacterium]
MTLLRSSSFFRPAAGAAFLLLALSACTSVPPTNVHQPMTMRPPDRASASNSNGAIYQPSSARPLFEDRRARYVGDILTITITENTAANSASNTSASRTGGLDITAGPITGVPGKTFQGMNVQTQSSNTFEGKGATSANNVFNGNITVTVIEVLSNGNLLVSGEKQVAIGNGTEFIRLSGIVSPNFIDASNTVPSSKVADARIEYKESGYISEAQVMGWLARFFLTVMPF